MKDFFLHYNFLTLTLLFAVPGILTGIARPDLRRTIASVIPCALPFACTEFLFYPSYWEPAFLFDLGRRIGFGVEDIIFVAGLAAFTSTAYAAAFNRTYAPLTDTGLRASVFRAAVLFALAGALLLVTLAVGITSIYGTCLVMTAAACTIIRQRPDLRFPTLLGGCLSAAVYFLLCLAADFLMPGLFKNMWHTDKLLNIFIAGVPLEELLYGFSAGFVATPFYPFVFGRRFIRRAANEVA
jgi:hypothetical protein